jgi:Ser/Thr protein kinase RdoA (MazF antagonist)
MEIPGYSIEREIGQGGMARVYLAVQRKFGRLVAIKVVSPEFTLDPEFGKRFVREARIVAQLTHPNIVQVHDAGVHDGHYYLVMEYMRGGDLNRRLQRGMHMQAVLSVTKDVARGLDHAHQKGYVHRDIKPENVLFREDGSAVVSDFGIARLIGGGATLTRQGTVVGTPQYMSPEQAAGRELDGRADLYSLGVVFFRMLTGDVPYKADSAVAVGIRHLQDPIPRLPTHLAVFQPVVNKFLAKRPEARFQTGADVIATLDGIRAEGVVPNAVIKGDVVSTAEIRAVTDVVPAPPREVRPLRVEADPGRRKRPRRRMWPWVAVVTIAAVGAAVWYYPDREKAFAELMLAAGLIERPELQRAWNDAESLRGDPNQSLAAIVAGYRRVLDLDPGHMGANEAIDALARKWKSDVTAALAADDLVLAEARLTDAVAVFPLDEELTVLYDNLNERKRALSLVASTQTLLRSHGLDDLPTVTAAIQAYQEVLRLHPTNATAQSELDRLASHYTTLAANAMESGNVTAAMSFLERASTANSKYPPLVELRATIQEAATLQTEIEGLLQLAGQYRASGALLNPPGENAAEIYHRVLATDPDNAIASQGLSQVVAQLLSRATEYLNAGRVDEVRAMNARALEIGLSDVALQALQAKLTAEEARIATVARLLEEAQRLIAEGFITEPVEQNAVAKALEVLRLDPANATAQKLLASAAERLFSVAREAYDAGLKPEGRHYLDLALTVTPDVPEWRVLRDTWAADQAAPTGSQGG